MSDFNKTDLQLAELYKAFYQNHPTPIYIWKYDGGHFVLTNYNNAADILTHGKIRDYLGIKASELYKDRSDIIEDLNRCFSKKINFSREIQYKYLILNEIKLLNVNYYFVPPDFILVHTDDITDSKIMKDALLKSEELYRNVVEEQTELIVRWTHPNGILTFVNDSYCRYFKKTREELIGKSFFPFIVKEDQNIVKERIISLTPENPIETHEQKVYLSNGNIAWQQWTNHAIYDDNGKLIEFQSVGRDITERKKAEINLKENEQFLQNIFDAIHDGISILDRDLNIIRVNLWMEQMYNDFGPLVGKKCYEVYQKRSSICPWCPSTKAFETGEIKNEIVPYPSAENPAGWIDLSAFPLKDEDGYVVNVIEYVKDITERKKAEINLGEHSKKLEIINRIITVSNRASNLSIALEIILTSTLELMHFDGGGIYLVDDSKRIAEMPYHKGLSSEFVDLVNRVNIDNAPYKIVFIEKMPIFSENYHELNPKFSDLEEMLSLASIPLFKANKVIGALNIASKKRYLFTETEKEILQSIGRETGSVIARLQVEEALRESQANLQILFNSIDDFLSVLDLEGNIIEVNPILLRRMGYSIHEILKMNVFDLHPIGENENIKVLFKEILEDKTNSYGIPLRTKDGTLIPVETRVSKGKWGKKSVIFGISRDITEQQNAENKIKESEEKFRTLINQSKDAIFRISLDNSINFANPAVFDVFGYSAEEFLNDPQLSKKILHPNYNPQFESFWTDYMNNKRFPEQSSEWCWIKKNGSIVYTENTFTNIFDNQDKIIGFQTVARDITNRKKTQQKLLESEKKHREAYNRSNLYKDLFTHDINNILQNVLTSVELFTLYSKNPQNQQKLEEITDLIKDQVLRGSTLVKNVQNLSEIEEIEKPLISIEINNLLNQAIDFIKKSFSTNNINIKIESIKNQIFVKANEFLINIFENILFNAVKHNQSENKEIIIKVSKEKKNGKNFIKFEFADNGIGIPNTMKRNIFSRDFRSYRKEEVPSGIGLGLLLVKSIIDSYNGEIYVEDRIQGDYSKGSNFIIKIPEAE